jgi:hypothetical protein
MHAKWHAELVWWRTLLTEWKQVQIAPRRSIMLKNELVTWDQEPLLTPMTDASRSKQKLKGGSSRHVWCLYYQAWKFDEEEVLNLDIMWSWRGWPWWCGYGTCARSRSTCNYCGASGS